MKTAFAIIAAALVGIALIAANLIANPIGTAAAAAPNRFELRMQVSINTEDHDFVLDRGMTLGECFSAARAAEQTGQVVGRVRVATGFYCEAAGR